MTKPTITIQRQGKSYVANVNGQPLVGRNGRPRLFKFEGSARDAAELDVWLRQQ